MSDFPCCEPRSYPVNRRTWAYPATLLDLHATREVVLEVITERGAQDAKWGQQDHPLGMHPTREFPWVGLLTAYTLANIARGHCEWAANAEQLTWADILAEEVFEAFAAASPAEARAELLQVAAVAVAAIESIDRNTLNAARPFPQPVTELQERDSNDRPVFPPPGICPCPRSRAHGPHAWVRETVHQGAAGAAGEKLWCGGLQYEDTDDGQVN